MASRKTWTIAMVSIGVLLVAGLTVGLVVGLGGDESPPPTFTVDHVENTFMMDGQPFRYVSGSFHYFRAFPDAWTNRLKTMRASGLNVVDTYVEWMLHNPYDGVYNWTGIADVQRFMELAQAEGFYVILRPGPYICAERDNGGLPHWLFTKYPDIRMRTSDPNYTREVGLWYAQLMPRLEKYLYGNGGPIIMVQVENEYGSFHACDRDYLVWLRDETERYVRGNALLFTTDIPNERVRCGTIEGVFATIDFGLERINDTKTSWETLRSVQPTGPLVNSEYYPGWLTHWQAANERRDGKQVADGLRKMLEEGANVNMYMFFGGTNFGFTAGANAFTHGGYEADITSYDYDAVMDEAGGVTEKYRLVRDVIVEFLGVPPSTTAKLEADVAAAATPRLSYGPVELKPIAALLGTDALATLTQGAPVQSAQPKSFEELNQFSGLVLYETTLPALQIDPSLLTVADLRDRAFVYVDGQHVGTLSRENQIFSLPLSKGWGSRLQLLVENQGRINFDVANDTKGIFGDVTVQQFNNVRQPLTDWMSTALPLKEQHIEALVERYKRGDLTEAIEDAGKTVLTHGPVIYHGQFSVDKFGDTYLNTVGWGKGVAYVNGFNLGRYWPLVGPQLTLYVPKELLQIGTNTLVLVEYQRANINASGEAAASAFASLDHTPQLDG